MRHPLILLFVLSLHTLVLAYALRPDLFARVHFRTTHRNVAKAPDVPKPADPIPSPLRAPVHAPRTATVPGSGNPVDTATWLARQAHARERYVEKHFGPRIATLLAAPDAGLDALADLAKKGDPQALEAWNWRVDECQSADRPPAGVLARTSAESAPDTQADTLRQFADAVVQARRDADAQRAMACAKANTDRALLDAAYRDLTHLDTPAARLAAAELQYEEDGLLDRLIAALRELLRERPDAETQRALAGHLIESANAGERDEGLALLRQLAPNDAEALSLLAQCLGIGCGAMAPRPEEVGDLVRQSSELGFAWALERVIDDDTRAQRRVPAMGWSRYRQWLNAQGCFAAPSDLALRFLLADTQLEETLGVALTPPQNGSATSLALGHVQRAGDAARRRANCD